MNNNKWTLPHRAVSLKVGGDLKLRRAESLSKQIHYPPFVFHPGQLSVLMWHQGVNDRVLIPGTPHADSIGYNLRRTIKLTPAWCLTCSAAVSWFSHILTWLFLIGPFVSTFPNLWKTFLQVFLRLRQITAKWTHDVIDQPLACWTESDRIWRILAHVVINLDDGLNNRLAVLCDVVPLLIFPEASWA